MATQQEAIDLVKSGRNVFVTGGAGRGKSHVIRQITDNRTILCGPTGIAALNIGGITNHRAFGLPIGLPTQDDYDRIPAKVKKLLSNKNLHRIILDEVGMTSSMNLDMIDFRLRQARGNNLPFGGVQMVVVGDFMQLSPIVGAREKNLYFKRYKTEFAFGAACWDFTTVELEKAYRQGNEIHVKVLDSFRRKDKWAGRAFEWLGENTIPYGEGGGEMLHLCGYKADAERVNNVHYNRITFKEHLYHGDTNNVKWSNDVAVPQMVKLKEGAKVIIKANDPEGSYVNGERGIITRLYATSVMVMLDSGLEVEVLPFTWETYLYEGSTSGMKKKVEWTYSQIPLALGYGITVHSSQGMSLDGIAIDMGRGCFAHGQLYVAISRATDLNNISIASNIGMKDLIVDQAAKNFYGYA